MQVLQTKSPTNPGPLPPARLADRARAHVPWGLEDTTGQGSRAATEGGARRRLSMGKGCWHHMKVTSHVLFSWCPQGCPTVDWVLNRRGGLQQSCGNSPEGPECLRQAVESSVLILKLVHTACQVSWVSRKPANHSLDCVCTWYPRSRRVID